MPEAVLHFEGDGWGIDYDGERVLSGESYQICSNIVYALNNPLHWEPTECQEVADKIRSRRTETMLSNLRTACDA